LTESLLGALSGRLVHLPASQCPPLLGLGQRDRRRLETFAVARWADLRRKSPYVSTPNILALGDFNLPKTEPGDPICDELTSRRLQLPPCGLLRAIGCGRRRGCATS
jgi:hypothetical protein